MSTEQAATAATPDDTQSPAGQQQEQQTPEAGAAAEQDDAAKLWAELPDDGAENQPGKVGGEKISNEFIESQAEPDKDASAGEQDAGTAQRDKPASPPANDIWATASPELRAAHEAEVEALRRKTAVEVKAQAGRIRKLQQELQASAERAADRDAPKPGDTLDQGLADYPEIARPVKDALSPIEKKLERLDQLEAQQRSAQQEEVNSYIRSQQDLLEAAHPNWEQEYIQGPKAKQFYDWINSPDRPMKHVKTVFETNRDHIFDASAAIEVFDAFKADMAGTGPTPGNGQTQELSAKRAAQLDGSRSPRTPGGAPRVTGIPKEGDPQSIWKAFPDDNADERLQRRR